MRIAIVGHTLHGGGAEFVTRTWAQELIQRGHSVDLYTVGDNPHEEWAPRQASTVSLGALSHAGKVRYLRTLTQYDVVLAMQTYPALLVLIGRRVLARPGPCLMISERNISSILLKRKGSSERVQLALSRTLYRLADHVVAISYAVAADMVSSFNVRPERVTVVPNPAMAKFERSDNLGFVERSDSWPEHDLFVIVPARLVAQKRPVLAVHAVSELRDRGIDAAVVFCGDGPLEAQVRSEALRSDTPVYFKGWAELWFVGLPRHSVVLLCSICEGFGNVLVEAAGAGIPSVAPAEALGVADAIVPGVTGELPQFSDPSSLADALVRASTIEVHAGAWLERFSVARSTDVLEGVMAATVVQSV